MMTVVKGGMEMEENNMLEEVIVAVQDFICRVSGEQYAKTDEEVKALPEMTRLFMVLLQFRADRKE